MVVSIMSSITVYPAVSRPRARWAQRGVFGRRTWTWAARGRRQWRTWGWWVWRRARRSPSSPEPSDDLRAASSLSITSVLHFSFGILASMHAKACSSCSPRRQLMIGDTPEYFLQTLFFSRRAGRKKWSWVFALSEIIRLGGNAEAESPPNLTESSPNLFSSEGDRRTRTAASCCTRLKYSGEDLGDIFLFRVPSSGVC